MPSRLQATKVNSRLLSHAELTSIGHSMFQVKFGGVCFKIGDPRIDSLVSLVQQNFGSFSLICVADFILSIPKAPKTGQHKTAFTSSPRQDFLPRPRCRRARQQHPRYIQHFCPGLGWTPAKEPLRAPPGPPFDVNVAVAFSSRSGA